MKNRNKEESLNSNFIENQDDFETEINNNPEIEENSISDQNEDNTEEETYEFEEDNNPETEEKVKSESKKIKKEKNINDLNSAEYRFFQRTGKIPK